MKRNLLLEYSEELAIKIAKLCNEYRMDSNTAFQIKKSSSSVFANITEAQYPQSLADMHSKFEIARKECAEDDLLHFEDDRFKEAPLKRKIRTDKARSQ